MPIPSNPDAPAFPPLAGMSDLAMQGMTKRELVAAELFTRNRERYALCPRMAWEEADHFFAADPRNHRPPEEGDLLSFRVVNAKPFGAPPAEVAFAVETGGNFASPSPDPIHADGDAIAAAFGDGAFASEEEDAALVAMGRDIHAEWRKDLAAHPELPVGAVFGDDELLIVCTAFDSSELVFDKRPSDRARAVLRRVQRERAAKLAGAQRPPQLATTESETGREVAP